jgi:hypothetical protein
VAEKRNKKGKTAVLVLYLFAEIVKKITFFHGGACNSDWGMLK